MSAKEMFRNIRYECFEDEYFIRYKEKSDNIVKYEIVFCKENKDIELIPKMNDKDHYFTRVSILLLKAINQQCKELGWLDE